MGDARAVVQMRSDDKGDKKKKQAPEAEGAAMPDKALDSPGESIAALGAGHVERILASLQAAGGNSAVQTELSGLEEGRGAAVKAKMDVEAFKVMTDGQKVAKLAEKHGGQLPEASGKQAPAEGQAPAGMESPAAVVGFHQQRSGQLAALAAGYAAMQAKAAEVAATAGLDPTAQAAFAQAAAYFGQVGGEYAGLSATYMAVAADMAGNEYAALAAPPITAGALYQERIAILNEQRAALQAAAAAQLEQSAAVDGQVAAKDAEIASLAAQKADLDKQITEAGAAAKDAKGSKGGKDDKAPAASGGGKAADPAAQVAELSAQAAQLSGQMDRLRQARTALGARKGTHEQLSAVLNGKALALDGLIGAYNALIGAAAAAPTGRPEGGGGGK